MKTLKEYYQRSIEQFGENVASCMYEGECLTYSQHAEAVAEVSAMLASAGLNSGDRVALLSNNMPNWGVCYFAVVNSGMILVQILPDFSPAEINGIIKHSGAKALLVSDKLFGKVSKANADAMNIVIRTKNLGIISQTKEAKGKISAPSEDDTAALIYTSGTTSTPKGVMLSHGALCRQLEMHYELYPIASDDVFLSILPLAHTYECSVGMLYPFGRGASVTYIDRAPTVSTLIPTFRAIRPTMMLSVPLIIEKIFKSEVSGRFRKGFRGWLYRRKFFRRWIHRVAGRRLFELFGGRLRFFGIGGAKLDPRTEQFLMDARFPYAIGYGLTETAPLLAAATPDIVRLGSTGKMLKGIEAKVVNVNAETGEGELLVKTPSVMQGYYKNPEATAEVFTKDGWFRTKDLCRFDEEGFLFIKGRVGNMIVGASGENIYPEEIEEVINSNFWVVESVVREDKGRLVALVHFDWKDIEQKYRDLKSDLSAKKEEIKAELIKSVNARVNKFSRISSVEEHEKEFKKTPTKKIKRFYYTRKKSGKTEK